MKIAGIDGDDRAIFRRRIEFAAHTRRACSAFVDIESKETAWENADRWVRRFDRKAREAFEQDHYAATVHLDARDALTDGVPCFVAIFSKFELVDLQFRIAGNLRERAWNQNEICPCPARRLQNRIGAQFHLRRYRPEVGRSFCNTDDFTPTGN